MLVLQRLPKAALTTMAEKFPIAVPQTERLSPMLLDHRHNYHATPTLRILRYAMTCVRQN
jgi:hypothetical protein